MSEMSHIGEANRIAVITRGMWVFLEDRNSPRIDRLSVIEDLAFKLASQRIVENDNNEKRQAIAYSHTSMCLSVVC